MRVLIRDSEVCIEPDYGDGLYSTSIRVSRPTGQVSVSTPSANLSQAHDQPDPATCYMDYGYAIIGIVTLLRGPYLLYVTDAATVAYVAGHEVLRVERIKVLPLADHELPTPTAVAQEKKFVQMLSDTFTKGSFYFCITMDLTHSFQRQAEIGMIDYIDRTGLPNWKLSDKRFFWNWNIVQKLADAGADEWIVPMISGFVELHKLVVGNSNRIELLLISRREWYNAGTRYTTRGADPEGHVANYAEQEQAVLYMPPLPENAGNGKAGVNSEFENSSKIVITSFVQTRGSIPIFWRQKVDLRYSPKIEILDESKAGEVFHKHFDEQVKLYSEQIIINLVNQTGSEGKLEKKYKELVQASRAEDHLSYVGFDFHKECKSGWKNLSRLLQKVDSRFEEMGYFHAEYIRSYHRAKFVVSKKQKAVFRTNCMDCLDRTNVVQSLFAKKVLETQLYNIGLVESPESLEKNPKFDFVFKNLWADNADAMSLQYSGTGALKTDYTRTGKRTRAGMLLDFKNSAMRYYLNNFQDGERQDALDLSTGKYVPQANQQLLPSKHLSIAWLFRQVLLLVFVLLFVLSLLVSFLGVKGFQLSTLEVLYLSVLLCPCLTYVLARARAKDYVSRPMLIPRP